MSKVSWHNFAPGEPILTETVISTIQRHIESGRVTDAAGKLQLLDAISHCGHDCIVFSPFSTGWGASPLNVNCWRTTDGKPITPTMNREFLEARRDQLCERVNGHSEKAAGITPEEAGRVIPVQTAAVA